MSSLRARLRAERGGAGEASTTRSFEFARAEEKTVDARERFDRASPRTPREMTGWDSSTRTTAWDSARGSGEDGSARRRWRALAEAEAEARVSVSGEKVSVTTANARRVFSDDVNARRGGRTAFASVVKAARDAKQNASLAASPAVNTKQAFAESATARRMNQRYANRLVVDDIGAEEKCEPPACLESDGDRDMKLAPEVEEEVLKILRSVVEDARKERTHAVAVATALSTMSSHSRNDERTNGLEQSVPALMAYDTALDPNVAIVEGDGTKSRMETASKIRGTYILVFIGAMIFGALCGCALSLSPRRGHEDPRPVRERVAPKAALTLADLDLDASWIVALDRARIFHNSLTDEGERRRLRSAAKRARDARREALDVVASRRAANMDAVASDDELTRATCRAVRAFAELDDIAHDSTVERDGKD